MADLYEGGNEPLGALKSGVDSSSLGSYRVASNSPLPPKKGRSPVCKFKTKRWKDILWQDRVTVAYLTFQTVTEILARCNNIAEQNHNHRMLENVFRLSSLYNDLLALGAKDNKGIATSCRNTCPILLHPLRKLSITKILQVLAQCRAEQCCRSLVDGLLDTYKPTDSSSSVIDMGGNELTPDNSDNSSIEVYRFKYLGVIIDRWGNWKLQNELARNKGKNALQAIDRCLNKWPNIGVKNFINIYNALVE
ncbi:hypothetical protein ANN_01079 [Periplaneta americana]|uniref:Uncharacterized protein n=1 Tax=Periplaneta americana TaxID=6978 RepID=A0ABQ8TVM0_PERAM|nr:hypothetical protein ANN_01079 [Periplaneta americana]